MKEPNRERKQEIKALTNLSQDQKDGKATILENNITLVTGQAGSGKSLLCANIVIDMSFKKQIEEVFIVRPTIEVGKSLGYLPGGLDEKYDPYIEAFKENLFSAVDVSKKEYVSKLITEGRIKMLPLQFIRGKTINSLLIVEEIQNATLGEVEAILTRLGKNGKIILNGDSQQKDISGQSGIDLCYDLAKHIKGFAHVKLQTNHRHGIVSDILDYISSKRNKSNA